MKLFVSASNRDCYWSMVTAISTSFYAFAAPAVSAAQTAPSDRSEAQPRRLASGIPATTYAKRRHELMNRLAGCVEPGVYLQHRFGIRIEDIVLVTARGRRLLTKALPRTVHALEAWMEAVRANPPE